MLTKRAKRELLDKLHRGFVRTMVGITGVCLVCITYDTYTMITKAKEKEKIMFAELEAKNDPEEFPGPKRYPSVSFH